MTKVQSVDLVWHKSQPGVLPLGKHAVSDQGYVAAALRDNLVPGSYCLVSLTTNARGDVETEVGPSFSMDAVRHVETTPNGGIALAVTDNDLSYMNTSSVLIDRTAYQPGRGMIFVDVALAGFDSRRTFAILSMNRDGESYTLSAAEGGESLVSLWTKTWPTAITAMAISADGGFIAIGLNNGVAVLLDRTRQIVWESLPDDQEHPAPVASICVDNAGGVVSVDDYGEVKRHHAAEGDILWRRPLGRPSEDRMAKIQTALYNVAADASSRIVAATAVYYGASSPQSQLADSHYTLIDGGSGAPVWRDELGSPAAGVAVAPSGKFVCINTREGALTTLSIKLLQETGLMSSGHEFAMAQALYEEARFAADNGEVMQAAPLLEEALRLNPSHSNATVLFDEVVWHVREETMATTTQVSEESLEKVEAALKIAPYDERLTIRRNALARLVAEQCCTRATQSVNEGRDDEALVLLKRALSLDRHNVDIRVALKNFQDRYIGRLYQQSQTLLARQMHDQAIDLLEKVQSLRPDEPGVAQRLSFCRAAQAFKAGVQHYNLKHFEQAAFQFKKTLMLQPGHAEALRYLKLIENPAADQPAAGDVRSAAGSASPRSKSAAQRRTTSPLATPRDARSD